MQSRPGIRLSAYWVVAIALTSVGCSGATITPDNSDEGTSASVQSEARRFRRWHGSAGSSGSGAAGQGSGGSSAGGSSGTAGGASNGGEPSSGGQPGSGGVSSGGQSSGAAGSAGSAGGGSPTAAAPSLGSNSLAYRYTFTNTARLDSAAIQTSPGSTLLAMVAMGTLSNMHAPSDNSGDTFGALLPAHNYVNWMGSGQQLFAATNVVGGQNTVISETMPDPNDEVTLSVVEIRGAHKISAVSVAETPTKGPVTSASVTTNGPAILVSWWWGDGGMTQISATTSPGWTRVHSLSRAQADTNVVQTEVAAKTVDAAGTYSITWSSDPDQGAVVYLVAIE